MRGRLLFVAGLGAGYVLGARAGRRRYEQIKAAGERVWNTPAVQHQVDQVVQGVQGFVADKAPEVQAKVTDAAKKAASAVGDKVGDTVRRSKSDAPGAGTSA
jgi:hypothetical protein